MKRIVGGWMALIERLPGRLGWAVLFLPFILVAYAYGGIEDFFSDSAPVTTPAATVSVATEDGGCHEAVTDIDTRVTCFLDLNKADETTQYTVTLDDGRSATVECPPGTLRFFALPTGEWQCILPNDDVVGGNLADEQ